MFTRHTTEFAPVNTTSAISGAMVTLAETMMLETESGWKAVADLMPGERVATLDGGFAPIAWVGQTQKVERMFRVSSGALGNCSETALPAQTLIGRAAPAGFTADSDHLSLPVSALDGIAGVRAAESTPCRTLGFEGEEMIWAQTGMLVHAQPMREPFFHTLSFADARAFIALEKAQHFDNAVAA